MNKPATRIRDEHKLDTKVLDAPHVATNKTDGANIIVPAKRDSIMELI